MCPSEHSPTVILLQTIEEIAPETHDDNAAVAAQIGDQVSAAAEAVQPAAPQYPATTF